MFIKNKQANNLVILNYIKMFNLISFTACNKFDSLGKVQFQNNKSKQFSRFTATTFSDPNIFNKISSILFHPLIFNVKLKQSTFKNYFTIVKITTINFYIIIVDTQF